MKIDYPEIERIMNELAIEKGYVNYGALKNEYAKKIGFRDWEHYQGFLIRRREEREEEEERRKRRESKKKKGEKRMRQRKELRRAGKEEKLEQAIFCGLF